MTGLRLVPLASRHDVIRAHADAFGELLDSWYLARRLRDAPTVAYLERLLVQRSRWLWRAALGAPAMWRVPPHPPRAGGPRPRRPTA